MCVCAIKKSLSINEFIGSACFTSFSITLWYCVRFIIIIISFNDHHNGGGGDDDDDNEVVVFNFASALNLPYTQCSVSSLATAQAARYE